MKAGGLRTNVMEINVSSSMLTITPTLEITSKGGPMARAPTDGQKMNTIKESGKTDIGTAEVDIRKVVQYMSGNGSNQGKRDTGSRWRKMDRGTRDCGKTTREMASAEMITRMEECI
jgi:hypothetical protein